MISLLCVHSQPVCRCGLCHMKPFTCTTHTVGGKVWWIWVPQNQMCFGQSPTSSSPSMLKGNVKEQLHESLSMWAKSKLEKEMNFREFVIRKLSNLSPSWPVIQRRLPQKALFYLHHSILLMVFTLQRTSHNFFSFAAASSCWHPHLCQEYNQFKYTDFIGRI